VFSFLLVLMAIVEKGPGSGQTLTMCPRFGSARWDSPSPKVSGFTGLPCHQKGYGLGKVVSSGTPQAYLQQLLSRQKLLSL
jgi:hypothetical protein